MASTVNDIHLIGLAAARPAAAAANKGYYYTATDTSGGTTYRSDAATWTQIAGGVTGGAPSGAAGGDLSGTYPNPTVAKANGNTFPAGVVSGDVLYGSGANTLSRLAAGSAGDVLTMSGGLPAWTFPAGPTGAAGGDLSGTYPNPTVAKANGNSFPSGIATGDTIYGSAANTLSKLGIGSVGQVLTVAGGLPTWAASAGGAPSGAAGGDLSGTYPNPTVAKINGNTVPAGAVAGNLLYGSAANAFSLLAPGTNGFVLTLSAGLPAWVTPPSAPPNGAAGGDLSGTYPNPTVAKANGNSFPSGVTTGDLIYGTSANTLNKLAIGTVGNVLQVLAGVPIWGAAPGGPPTGAAGGDLSGTYPNPTVAKANGNSFPSGVATGDILYGSGANALSKLAAGTNGFVLTLAAGIPSWVTPPSAPPNGAAGGDLSGTYPNPTVAKANGNAFPASIATGDIVYGSAANTLSKLAAGTNGFLLTLSGGIPAWVTPPSAPPNGAAGGDLSGTYPNPTVAKANGNSFPASVATGDLIYGSGASALSRLAVGATDTVLTVAGGVPTWATPAPSGVSLGKIYAMAAGAAM